MLDAASACGGRTGTGRVRQGCLCHDPYADRIEQAMAVARVLDIPSSRVHSRENNDSIYDVSVVIGKDFKSIKGSN